MVNNRQSKGAAAVASSPPIPQQSNNNYGVLLPKNQTPERVAPSSAQINRSLFGNPSPLPTKSAVANSQGGGLASVWNGPSPAGVELDPRKRPRTDDGRANSGNGFKDTSAKINNAKQAANSDVIMVDDDPKISGAMIGIKNMKPKTRIHELDIEIHDLKPKLEEQERKIRELELAVREKNLDIQAEQLVLRELKFEVKTRESEKGMMEGILRSMNG